MLQYFIKKESFFCVLKVSLSLSCSLASSGKRFCLFIAIRAYAPYVKKKTKVLRKQPMKTKNKGKENENGEEYPYTECTLTHRLCNFVYIFYTIFSRRLRQWNKMLWFKFKLTSFNLDL